MTGVLIFLALVISTAPEGNTINAPQNVTIEGNTQVVSILAKGGYSPELSVAKANFPTILRLITDGTFDCSLALTVPLVGYRENLPTSGVTEIVLPSQNAGAVVNGVCTMGMYSFSVRFE